MVETLGKGKLTQKTYIDDGQNGNSWHVTLVFPGGKIGQLTFELDEDNFKLARVASEYRIALIPWK